MRPITLLRAANVCATQFSLKKANFPIKKSFRPETTTPKLIFSSNICSKKSIRQSEKNRNCFSHGKISQCRMHFKNKTIPLLHFN